MKGRFIAIVRPYVHFALSDKIRRDNIRERERFCKCWIEREKEI